MTLYRTDKTSTRALLLHLSRCALFYCLLLPFFIASPLLSQEKPLLGGVPEKLLQVNNSPERGSQKIITLNSTSVEERIIKVGKNYLPIDVYEEWQLSLPRFALKTNLLYGVTTLTPNIGADLALSPRSTVGFLYSYNRWKQKASLDDNTKFLHGLVGLQYRFWLCERFSGHFIGADYFYSEYNICGHYVPLLFEKEHRYEGNAHGIGALYGYALPIGKMWNLEFGAGLNCFRLWYDRYGCRTCDRNSISVEKTKLLPSASINLLFLIK